MKCTFLSGRQTLYSRPKNIMATRSFEVREYCKSKRPQFYILCPKSSGPEIKEKTTRQDIKGLRPTKQERKIAEAIILQAVEDLWVPVHRKESIEFFTGEGFAICARIVGMGLYEKLRLILLIKKSMRKKDPSYPKQFLKQAWG